MSQPSRSLRDRLHRYSPLLVNGAGLALALGLAPHLAANAAVPLGGIVLLLVMLASARTLAPAGPVGIGREWWLYTRGQLAAGIACVVIGRLVWNWSWPTFTFLPLWIGLTWLAFLRHLPALRLARPIGLLFTPGNTTAFAGALAVGITAFLFGRLAFRDGLGWPSVLGLAATWLMLDRLPVARWQDATTTPSRMRRFGLRLLLWAASAALVLAVPDGAPARSGLALVLVTGLTLALFGLSHRQRVVAGPENGARILLGLLAAWLVQPFASSHLLGSQDAQWYLNTLADFLAQVRTGVFPVFVGQSEHLFNGGVLPVRFAPLFQHYGLALDLLTLRTLPPVAVQNGVIMGCLFGAAFTSRAILGCLLPGRIWLASALSALFLTCPGLLAIVFYEDLFMTWTTLPWLPLVFGGCALSLRSRETWPLVLTGGALGVVWWGHAPVALWTTVAVAGIQATRLAIVPPREWPWRSLAAAGAAFGAIALYPVISVLAVPVQTGAESLNYTATDPSAVVYFVRESFPGILVPLFFKSRAVSDFQAGWALIGLWGLCLAALLGWRMKTAGFWALLAVPLGLQLLLLPVPWLNGTLWSLVPGFLINPTGTWPMQRLYVIIAISGVCAAAALAGHNPARKFPLWLHLGLAAGVLWSVAAAFPLLQAKNEQRRKLAEIADATLPENRVLTRYAYLVFGRQPAYYLHGYMDPRYEQRFLSGAGRQWIGGNPNAILTDPAAGRVLAEGTLTANMPHPGTPWQVSPKLRVEPHENYVLELHFKHPAEPGVLLVNGPGLNRVYALPAYGEKFAFGAGPEASPLLPLTTSGTAPIEVSLQFVAQDPKRAVDFTDFGTYRWLKVDPTALPVQVTGWIPYQANVNAPAAVWLETPRMFHPGYRSTVNGRDVPVEKSPEGLVAVPVPAGRSTVVVSYHAPWLLQFGYWTSASAILVCVAALLRTAWRHCARVA